LTNAILKQERVIVSDIEGTTRDAIDTPFVRDDKQYVVIDTAGLKKKGKIFESIDKYAALRALSAIDRSDVCALVIDANAGVREQDKHVAGYALEAGKAVVIVVNKWDLVKKDSHTMAEYEKKIREEFKFLSFAPIVFVSALTKEKVENLFSVINDSYEGYTTRISTSVLNEVLLEVVLRNPPVEFNGGILKISYAHQVSSKPPVIVMFVNNPEWLHFSYQRFLENKLREAFGFVGTPLIIKCRAKG
jgi:GTP-binding protein